MTLGRYDQERRRRQRFWILSLKAFGVATILLLLSLFSYQIGVERQKGREAAVATDAEQLRRQLAELQQALAHAQEAQRSAEIRAAEVEARMEREQPRGEFARLTRMLSDKLAVGVDPNRLAFVLDQIRPARVCEGSETKRFVLGLPQQRGGAGVTFAGGAITVNGEGVPARNARNQPEPWFDPAQPVVVKIADAGGRSTEMRGILPLRQSLVVGGTEHRFAASAGPKSFIEVRTERCPFP
ncbi:hypothetical protein [Arenibaculum pallidiluteum]|uniref:hypothetical protein n=1 Tax=Arenibaculum pallidiluteum TaxID=2812559 RepID=UPI001A9644D2|nr:hypothetical protein [Arenibaculum pallidiluteum]